MDYKQVAAAVPPMDEHAFGCTDASRFVADPTTNQPPIRGDVAAALRCSGAVRQMFCESDLLAAIYAVRHGVAVVEAPR